jgi:hypothetical protein
LRAGQHVLSIRSKTALARVVLDQEREADAGNERENAERQIGAAPA